MNLHSELLVGSFIGLLVYAAVYDYRFHKIRNWLVLSVLIIGVIVQWQLAAVDGIFQAVGGIVVGFAAFIPLYIKKAMAAGDVKLMAAVGATLGYSYILYAVAATLVAGAVLAILMIVFKGEIGDFLNRWVIMTRHFIYTRKILWLKPKQGSVAAGYFPYAAAIACGSLVTLWFSSLRPALG